jgi:hypothetical protein
MKTPSVPWLATTPASLIDAPARAALLHARTSALSSVAPAVTGLALVSLASLAGAAFVGATHTAPLMLRGLLEAIGFTTPIFVLALTSSHARLAPASVFSLVAVTTGVAGLAAVLVLPLLAFLWLCSTGGESHLAQLAMKARLVAAPTTFLLALPVVLTRGLMAMGVEAKWSTTGFGALAFITFAVRASPALWSLS